MQLTRRARAARRHGPAPGARPVARAGRLAAPPRPWACWLAGPRPSARSDRAAVPLGEAATLSVLELLLARAASPIVVLEPARRPPRPHRRGAREVAWPSGPAAHCPICARRQLGSRRRAVSNDGPALAALLRLVADLDALEGKWPVSAGDRASLAEVRSAASAFVGVRIDSAVCGQILAPLEALAQPEGLSDEGVEQLEETARHPPARHRRRQARACRQRRCPARWLSCRGFRKGSAPMAPAPWRGRAVRPGRDRAEILFGLGMRLATAL